MIYTLRFFFSSKCSLFHNSNVFGSCIIHILYTECAKIKKNNSGPKRLNQVLSINMERFCLSVSPPYTTPPPICQFIPASRYLSFRLWATVLYRYQISGVKAAWACVQTRTVVCRLRCSPHSFGLQNIFSNRYQNTLCRSVFKTKRMAWLCIEIQLNINKNWVFLAVTFQKDYLAFPGYAFALDKEAVNSKCRYQSITQQYLNRCLIKIIVTTCFGPLRPLSGFHPKVWW